MTVLKTLWHSNLSRASASRDRHTEWIRLGSQSQSRGGRLLSRSESIDKKMSRPMNIGWGKMHRLFRGLNIDNL